MHTRKPLNWKFCAACVVLVSIACAIQLWTNPDFFVDAEAGSIVLSLSSPASAPDSLVGTARTDEAKP